MALSHHVVMTHPKDEKPGTQEPGIPSSRIHDYIDVGAGVSPAARDEGFNTYMIKEGAHSAVSHRPEDALQENRKERGFRSLVGPV